MDVPEPSNSTDRSNSAPKPAAERRLRRAEVESRLIDGQSTVAVAETVAGMFGCSARTVRKDIGRVHRRWQREMTRGLDKMRARTVLALKRNARECHEKGDRDGERASLAHIAKCLGLHGPQVAVQVNQQVNHVAIVAVDPEVRRHAIASAARFLLGAGALRPDAGTSQSVDSLGADGETVGAAAAR